MTFLNLLRNLFFIIFFIIFFHIYKHVIYIKLYQLNIINKIKQNYTKKTRERYQNLSKEEKEKKRQYKNYLQKFLRR